MAADGSSAGDAQTSCFDSARAHFKTHFRGGVARGICCLATELRSRIRGTCFACMHCDEIVPYSQPRRGWVRHGMPSLCKQAKYVLRLRLLQGNPARKQFQASRLNTYLKSAYEGSGQVGVPRPAKSPAFSLTS